MATAWQILRDGGLPLAIAGTGDKRDASDLARAVLAAIAEQPTGREAEALAAYVFAWHQHWPASFARELDVDAMPTLEWAQRAAIDDNRYLKLRRIALESLSRIL